MPSVKILDTQAKFIDSLKIYSPNVDVSAANGEFETKYGEKEVVDYYKKELANYGCKVFDNQVFNNNVDGIIKKRIVYSCELENGLTFYLKFDEAKNKKDKNYYAIVIHGSSAMMASYNNKKDNNK